MTIETLFKDIQQNTVTDDLIIFKNPKNDFIANQYINEIAKQHNLTMVSVENIDDIKTTQTTFDLIVPTNLQIVRVDAFKSTDADLMKAKNVIISCNSISKEAEKLFKNYIVKVPELEKWQIKDYIYTQLEGTEPAELDWLAEVCKYDIYRIALEVDRLKIFPPIERTVAIRNFKEDLIYSDLSEYVIFDFINALILQDAEKVKKLYLQLSTMESSPLGIVALLYNNIKDIIMVHTGNMSAAEIGISSGKYWAVKYIPVKYNKDQYIKLFLLITNIDKQLKTGKLDVDLILDYLLVNIFII